MVRRFYLAVCDIFVTFGEGTGKAGRLQWPMFSKTTLLTICFLGLSVIPGCANPHFFPRLQPLFPGLNEAQLSSAGKNAVAKAKQDFVLVKHGESPAYARLVQADSPGGTKVYQG